MRRSGRRSCCSAAIGAAGAVNLTPGNVGIASAAGAIALVHVGVDPVAAAAAGLAFHGLETLAGIAFGSFGCLLRTGRVRLVPARAG